MEKEYIDGERRRTIKMSGAAAAALFGLGSVDTVSGQSTTKQKQAAKEFEEAFEDEVTVEEVITTEEVPQRTRTSQIRRSVTGEGVLGIGKLYQFSHTLEWSYSGRRVQSYNSYVDGKSLDVNIEYKGPTPRKEVDFSPQRSAVRVLREGRFSSDTGVNSYYPSIKIGGDGQGRGFVVDLDEGDPQP